MNPNISMFYGASPQLFAFAKTLRGRETAAEKKLWDRLSSKQICGLRFRRQHPVKYFIADFYCHQIKLIIEVDGGIHQESLQFEYDQNRDHELIKLDIEVLRFKNEEIEENMEQVVDRIRKIAERRLSLF